ncbi:hypothetical protein FIE12Z_8234 [Fusarium flagelliforme]|uniref:2EXR domain-containing protein n=1 Tax=Fusarium flagelliforme TaxID=2675880 RepID=A0A395MHZ1_9HYPO|nr:hypothetical protein FIE12Z_8234 [Fusarium flagelliforme]
MATPSLHRFPDLPTELRLQIWNSSCVPRIPNRHAVHYIDVDKDNSLTGHLEVFHRGFGDDETKSACLMDAGLWTTCRESRDVITKQWLATHSDGFGTLTKMLIRGNGEKDGQCLVSPFRDMFCLKARDWNIDPGSSRACQMFIKDTDGPSDPNKSPDVPETYRPNHYFRINNIAFEFDPSWVVDFPETYEDLMREASPRGFLSRLMYYRLYESEPGFNIWLIDKDTQWSWNPKWGIHRELLPGQTIDFPVDRFSDYDGDYMEANLVLRCKWCANERSGILDDYLVKVNRLGADCVGINGDEDYELDPGYMSIYDINEQARLLVRPDNQVELCTKDHYLINRSQDSDSDLYPDSDMGF